MTWTAYGVSFRLLSPMHIGWHKLGNLQQTRPYITGRSLWGALTARLTRDFGRGNYKDIGREVDSHLAFTYFYPYALPEEDSPWSRPEQWHDFLWPWSDRDKFTWTFLGSYASTSLTNGHNAETGSLHETEFIAPRTRDGRQVYLVGYIFETAGLHNEKQNPLSRWQSVLDRLQLGGERGYGWGRVRLQECCKKINNGKCFDYKWLPENARPQLQALGDTHLLAHTHAVTDSASNRKVTIEPLIGRETTAHTSFGNYIADAAICWVPGGKVEKNETFQIQPKGIWECFPPSNPTLKQGTSET
ncbi:MAG TPA: RAMP superfamily CRISPR-associated protein [Ktedonobacteraceae bacterium]|nr:RAMP superfamily CRISPR-associated protein [Ktedonobacteraceae bacterium]